MMLTKDAWKLTRRYLVRKCYLTQKAPSSVTTIAGRWYSRTFKGIDPNIDESEKGYKNFSVIENMQFKI